jgi:pyruvate/2-oxoglutarate dehydrogenase complex dihydrolipoamide acyltransferase (E2) component
MGNSAGGLVVVVLLVVAIIFGAGFLYSEDSQAVYYRQVADAAMVQAVQKVKDLEIEVGQLKAELAEANARADAAEQKAAGAAQKSAEAEQKAAAAAQEAAEAGQKAAEAQHRAAEAEQRAVDAAAQAAAERDARIRAEAGGAEVMEIPVTGEKDCAPIVVTPTPAPQQQSGKVMVEQWPWLVPGIGILFFGMMAAVISVGWKALNQMPRKYTAQADTKDFTYVKMTREEARLYARGRRK